MAIKGKLDNRLRISAENKAQQPTYYRRSMENKAKMISDIQSKQDNSD
jgi:hypothetical protein